MPELEGQQAQRVIAKNPNLQEIANDPVLMEERVLLWKSNFLLWFWDCFFTKDEGDGKEKTAPRFAYIKSLHEAIENDDEESFKRIANGEDLPRVYWVEKSRQLFVTWYMVARFLWKLMYAENIRLVYGSRVEDDVKDVIKNRFKEAYNRLDRAFPVPTLIFKSLTIENPGRGTLLTGMSSSGEGSRGKTGAELWLDEIAFQDEQDSLVRASMESFNSPISKIIGVTTPNPKDVAKPSKILISKSIDGSIPFVELSRGVIKKYNTKGHVVISLSHWAHPDKQEDWRDKKIKEIGQDNYDIEHGLNWEVAKGSPCFYAFNYAKHRKKLAFDPYLPLEIAVDPGTGHPAVVFFQRCRDGKCRVYHAFVRESTSLDVICDLIAEEIKTRFNCHGDIRFHIDPAGGLPNPHGTEIAAEVIWKYFRKPITPAPYSKPVDRLWVINMFFNQDRIEVQRDCGEYFYKDGNVETQAFIFMLTTGYCNNAKGEPHKDGTWDHFADAFGYGFINVFTSTRDLDMKEKEGFSVRPDYIDKQIVHKPMQPVKTFLNK